MFSDMYAYFCENVKIKRFHFQNKPPVVFNETIEFVYYEHEIRWNPNNILMLTDNMLLLKYIPQKLFMTEYAQLCDNTVV